MAQAKTLSDKDLKILLATIASRRHAPRNRAMVLMSVWAGMRVGEIASLKIGDVVAADLFVIRVDDFAAAVLGCSIHLGDYLFSNITESPRYCSYFAERDR